MLLSIILLLIISFGIYLLQSSYQYDILGFTLSFVFGIVLIMHVLFWSVSGYEYNRFFAKRQAFVETLEYARKNNNQLELASLTREVSKWNQDLAELKYNNTVFLLDDYVDDRIMDLKSIK